MLKEQIQIGVQAKICTWLSNSSFSIFWSFHCYQSYFYLSSLLASFIEEFRFGDISSTIDFANRFQFFVIFCEYPFQKMNSQCSIGKGRQGFRHLKFVAMSKRESFLYLHVYCFWIVWDKILICYNCIRTGQSQKIKHFSPSQTYTKDLSGSYLSVRDS